LEDRAIRGEDPSSRQGARASSARLVPPAFERQAEEAARAALHRGDHQAVVTALMRTYGEAVFAYCRSMVGSRVVADDVLQLVFIQAYGGLDRFEGRSTFKSWLFGIARHRCLDQLKQARRRARRWLPWRPVHEPAVEPLALDETGADAERRRALDECLAGLPVNTRDLVLLRFRQDLPYQDIETITGLPAATLRARVFRALSCLRRCLEEKGAAP
jgi:RNA polymerase sigma-70 factor (ECF subfamily)